MSRGWQSGWQPGPPQVQMWWWGPGSPRPTSAVATAASTTPVRIGDAERDRAVSALGDHFAAGRLTREELDERTDHALQARFGSELEPLFADLPKPAASQLQAPRPAGGPPPWAYALWMLPFLVVAGVAGAILLNAPFLIWGVIWVAVILKITGHKRRYRSRQLPSFSPSGRR